MRILIACEYSGVVREAFKAKGHDAWSCDILPTEIPGNHIQDDVLKHLGDGWDMMIAHPPCTYLSLAGANSTFKGEILRTDRYLLGLKAKAFFGAMYDAPIERIVIENPTPMAIFKLPPPQQVIQPFQFGHPFSKRTLLWLKNVPRLKHTNVLKNYESTTTAKWYNSPGKDRQKARAKTFEGIAKAMAEQWGSDAKG